MKLLLIGVLFVDLVLALTWVYIFMVMLTTGSVTWHEPDPFILALEFAAAVVIASMALVAMVAVAFRRG